MSAIDDVKAHVDEWVRKEGPSFIPSGFAAILELDSRVKELSSKVSDLEEVAHTPLPQPPAKAGDELIENTIRRLKSAQMNIVGGYDSESWAQILADFASEIRKGVI
jgi:hypothetical protein